MKNHGFLVSLVFITILAIAGCANVPGPSPAPRGTPLPSPTPLSLPIFEPGRCPTFISTTHEYECGHLWVLEDRDRPAGRTVKLPVIIFRSTGDRSTSNPVIYVPEGDGHSQIHDYERILDTVGRAILETHDLIIYNQRGSELTLPHFYCPDYDEFLREVYGAGWSQFEFNLATMIFWRFCNERLEGRDLDLNMYDSVANAADANDLRIALGYDQANYYAASYGTRIALNLIRDNPDGVRSLIIDSAHPPQVGTLSERAANAYRAFNELFEACANDIHCSEHYPNLEATFFQVVDDLNIHPVRIGYNWGTVMVTGDVFMHAIYTNLASAEAVHRIPQIIADAAAGDLVALEPTILDNLGNTHDNMAVFLTTLCREEVPFDTYEDVLTQIIDLPSPIASFYGESFASFHRDLCDFWGVDPGDPVADAPVDSDTPTLVLSGQFDPISPPEWGWQTAATLENGYFYELPNQGHSVMGSSDCGLSMGLSFLEDPSSEPDSSCINDIAPLDFEDHRPVPRFEPSGCYFNYLPDTARVECGYLVVPEDRSQPEGPTIKLHVAIFRSTGRSPAPDPIIYVAGGGGANHLDSYEFYLENGGYEILRGRDYIMYNQRGTRYNHPALECPGHSTLLRRLALEPLPAEEREAQMAEFLLDCHDDLQDRGINLDVYNSDANAADINDLRVVLGYDQINLYGTSYGTRVILGVLRDHPEGIRSAIIDSVFPPQVDLYEELPYDAHRAFNALFEDCAADPACSDQYPHLEETFYQVVDELNADPTRVGVSWVDGNAFMDAIFSALYDVDAIPQIPQWIHQASSGNHSGLLRFYEGGFRDDNSERHIAHGVHYSLLCREEAPFNEPADAMAQSDELPAQIQQWMGWPDPDIQLCASWDSGIAEAIEDEPVYSDIPTLVFAGRYDPITPPAWSRLAAETLSHSHLYEFPNIGHGVMRAHPCALEIGLQFLDDPDAEPDSSCLAELGHPEFE
jgi:pimeloyl-ACP methyl ester carboxylesterase